MLPLFCRSNLLRYYYYLAKLLSNRWIRATELHKVTELALENFRSSLSSTMKEPVSDVTVEQWITEYRKVITSGAENSFGKFYILTY